jgi:hypothetical protein
MARKETHHLETNKPKSKNNKNERQMFHSSSHDDQTQKATTRRIKHTRKKKNDPASEKPNYKQAQLDEDDSITTTQSMEYSSEEETADEKKAGMINRHSDESQKMRKGLSKAWKEIFAKRITTNTAPNPREKSAEKPSAIQSRITTQQLNNHEYNIPFGNDISSQNKFECFLFHNINGIKDNHNWLQINMTMKDLNVTCFGFAEINTSMRGNQFNNNNNTQ